MSIKAVKQYSDRGSIKDLSTKSQDEVPPSPFELRMQKLYEYAQLNNNRDLQSTLGFITTDYISDKNALPLSVYRIRKIVADIKSKSPEKIDHLSQQFAQCMEHGLSAEAISYFNTKSIIKSASARKSPVFWRARKI